MRLCVITFLMVCSLQVALCQPGNGNGNGHGNGQGGGNCGNPPCGGPHQNVPVDAGWLLCAGLLAGFYLKFKLRKAT